MSFLKLKLYLFYFIMFNIINNFYNKYILIMIKANKK